MEDYVRACEAPMERVRAKYYTAEEPRDEDEGEHAWAATEISCSELIERLSAIKNPTPVERLALLMARLTLSEVPRQTRCEER